MSMSLQLPTEEELDYCRRAAGPGRRKKAVRGPIVADLPIESIVAVIDTREQLPHDLHPLKMEVNTLKTGDYSVRGLERFVAIERKNPTDFLSCVGVERDRFDACVQRMLAYPHRAIVIEMSREEVNAGNWKSKVTPSSAWGSIMAWMSRGIPVLLSGDRDQAAKDVFDLLVHAARQRWRESRELLVSAQRIEEGS